MNANVKTTTVWDHVAIGDRQYHLDALLPFCKKTLFSIPKKLDNKKQNIN